MRRPSHRFVDNWFVFARGWKHNLDFDELKTTHQNEKAYVFLLAHLTEKNKEDFSGAETKIFKAFEKNDISWFPHKFSWEMQACGVDAELADEDALEKALAEMRIKIGEDSETLRTLTMKIIDEQRKQREMFDEFKISFDSLKEGLRSQSQNSN